MCNDTESKNTNTTKKQLLINIIVKYFLGEPFIQKYALILHKYSEQVCT